MDTRIGGTRSDYGSEPPIEQLPTYVVVVLLRGEKGGRRSPNRRRGKEEGRKAKNSPLTFSYLLVLHESGRDWPRFVKQRQNMFPFTTAHYYIK